MKTFSAVCVIAVLAASSSNGFAADSFDQSIRPLLRDYCVTCHSTEKVVIRDAGSKHNRNRFSHARFFTSRFPN